MNICNYCGKETENTTENIIFGCACEECDKRINSWIKIATSRKFKCNNCFPQRTPYVRNTETRLEFVCPKCNSVMFWWDKDYETKTIKKFVKDSFLSSNATQLTQQAYTQNTHELPARCPKCFSTQITTGSRGYSLAWGFIGANKTVNRCAKCGHSWQPKK